ncbi:MAG: leucyl aminopeptidase [Planctomycetes bacterium]|nr:leucyl aminopeptidase [Planctomycetota bacterium]MBU1518827.1 leucyl aminopeptidase [Planctomycetota bacterium]MBU2458263.1 leucyl aminopeptidase [Planctomycetota bacterium]MBU2597163.1 leucyl aminopeptidase [Planctomycetota bacterium]
MAKQIIKIDVKAVKADITKLKVDVAAVGIFSDVKPTAFLKKLDALLGGAITRLKKIGDFKASAGSSVFLYTHGEIAAERLLLVGLGEKKKKAPDTVRQAASKAAFEAVNVNAKTLAIFRHNETKIDSRQLGQVIAESIHFGGYRYDEFVTRRENGRTNSLSALIVDSDMANVRKMNEGIKIGQIVGRAQNFARTLCNRPGSILYPAQLAAEARKIAASVKGLSCTILDEKKLAQKKMGGILAVGKGAANKPRMIILKYSPGGGKKSDSPIALVGKAITFDTGGISLKHSADMHEMKYDMTGGAAVLMAMQVAAKLKLPVEVYGIICAAENKPDGGSCLPGDIITTFSGRTVEVLNTDAEGRLVLSDGLEQARRLKCKTVIDLATLTGACVVALGKHKAGLFSNDDKLAKKLQTAAKDSSEAVWQLPYEQEYIDEIKGKIADLKNIGSKWGGVCTGAAFLGEFAKGLTWAHLDIAPKMDASEPMKKYAESGSIGFGVRLLTSFLFNEVF